MSGRHYLSASFRCHIRSTKPPHRSNPAAGAKFQWSRPASFGPGQLEAVLRARCNANLQLVVLLDQDQDHDQEFLCDAYPAPDTQSTATRLAESLAPVNDFPKADVFFFEGTADIRCVAWCPPLRLNVFCGHCPCSFPLIALLASHPWALHLPEFVAATPPPHALAGSEVKMLSGIRVPIFTASPQFHLVWQPVQRAKCQPVQSATMLLTHALQGN